MDDLHPNVTAKRTHCGCGVGVITEYTRYYPGRYWGPPEDCYPDDYEELEPDPCEACGNDDVGREEPPPACPTIIMVDGQKTVCSQPLAEGEWFCCRHPWGNAE